MAAPYTVTRPVYNGASAASQTAASLSFAPMGPPRRLIVPQSTGPYGYSSLPHSYRLTAVPGTAYEEKYYDDLPNLRGSPGLIILCIYLLTVCSMFACLGRTDFNFVLYLLGYHIWCVEGDRSTTAGLRRLVRGARQFAVLLSLTTLVDISWHFVAFSSWVCEKDDAVLCFPEPQNLHVRWTYTAHCLALYLSLINLVLKVNINP